MAHNDIHKLIEQYFDATLSVQEERILLEMLAETNEDTDDIREAKATMGLFSTNRKLYSKPLPLIKPTSAWGWMKYAAILVAAILSDTLVDFDNPVSSK